MIFVVVAAPALRELAFHGVRQTAEVDEPKPAVGAAATLWEGGPTREMSHVGKIGERGVLAWPCASRPSSDKEIGSKRWSRASHQKEPPTQSF